MNHCLIAFGSNMGDEDSVFERTVTRLGDVTDVTISATSQPIRTAPVGGPVDQPNYLNAAICLQTRLDPTTLHKSLIKIETGLGRERRVRWGARKIDLDLLLYENECLETETLTIPHPRMSFRRFVLQPATEIAGEMRHPVADMTVHELIDHLNRTADEILWVTRISPEVGKLRERILSSDAGRDWKIHLVDEAPDFETLRAGAKLVVWDAERPMQLRKQTFRGPQLELPTSLEKIETELLAAIEAMKPISAKGSPGKF